jgi:hypothetical protein
MAKPLLPDELREITGPLLLGWSPNPEGGQPRVPDRQSDDSGHRIPRVLHGRLRGAQEVDRSRALVGSKFVRAAYIREATGTSPMDRVDPGSEHHLSSAADDIPLAMSEAVANADDTSPDRCPCSVPSRRWQSFRPGRGDCNA